jgi:hypothetical protein
LVSKQVLYLSFQDIFLSKTKQASRTPPIHSRGVRCDGQGASGFPNSIPDRHLSVDAVVTTLAIFLSAAGLHYPGALQE